MCDERILWTHRATGLSGEVATSTIAVLLSGFSVFLFYFIFLNLFLGPRKNGPLVLGTSDGSLLGAVTIRTSGLELASRLHGYSTTLARKLFGVGLVLPSSLCPLQEMSGQCTLHLTRDTTDRACTLDVIQ
jgi:hypothetical protein